ncbi:hypothetical protein HMI55_004577, partial [Coelomomyces lativittatus]
MNPPITFFCIFILFAYLPWIMGLSNRLMSPNSSGFALENDKFHELDHCMENLDRFNKRLKFSFHLKPKYKDDYIFTMPCQVLLSEKWTQFLNLLKILNESRFFEKFQNDITCSNVYKNMASYQAELKLQALTQELLSRNNPLPYGENCNCTTHLRVEDNKKCEMDFWYFQSLLKLNEKFCPRFHHYRQYLQHSFYTLTSFPLSISYVNQAMVEKLKKFLSKLNDFKLFQDEFMTNYYNRASHMVLLHNLQNMANILSDILKISTTSHSKSRNNPKNIDKMKLFLKNTQNRVLMEYKHQLKKYF